MEIVKLITRKPYMYCSSYAITATLTLASIWTLKTPVRG